MKLKAFLISSHGSFFTPHIMAFIPLLNSQTKYKLNSWFHMNIILFSYIHFYSYV